MFGIKIKFEKDRPSAGSVNSPQASSGQAPSASSGQADQVADQEKKFDMRRPDSGPSAQRVVREISEIRKAVPEVKKITPEVKKIVPEAALEETVEQKKLGRAWDTIARWTLYALIFLTPIFFLPWGMSPVVQNKQFLATVLIAIAFIAWLAKTIASGKLVWPKTPINIAVWFLAVVWAISSLFSISKYRSVGLVGLEHDSLLNIIKYALAFFLIGATFSSHGNEIHPAPSLIKEGDKSSPTLLYQRREEKGSSLSQGGGGRDLNKAVYAFLASVAILAVFTGLKLCGINFLAHSTGSGQAWDFAKAIDFNTIGTVNGLALFLGAGLIVVIGLLGRWGEFGYGGDKGNKGLRAGLIVLAIIIAAELVLINFNFVWWPLIGAMLFLVAYIFARETQEIKTLPRNNFVSDGSAAEIKSGGKHAPQIQKLIFPLLILGVSVILLLVRVPAFFQFSQEVRPTNQATYDISKNVLKSKGISTDLFGSGPGTFTFDYGLYRGPLNNRNPLENLFWGVRFNQGFSFASTALATTGVLGVLALALLIFSFIWQVFRKIGADLHFENNSSRPPLTLRGEVNGGVEFLRAVSVSVVIYFFISWFLYPANFSLLMFSFVFLGLMVAANATGEKSSPTLLYQRREEEGSSLLQREGRRDLREISLLVSPQRTMIISLLLIILMIGSVSLLYVESQKYIASLYFASGLKTFNASQNVDSALAQVGRAINLDSVVDDYQRAASQLFLVKTKSTLDSLQSASGVAAEPLKADFQNNMARTVSFAQQAQILNSNESANWTNLGYVYENVLFFVDGSENWMTMAYEKAAALEPQNPALRADLGRAHLAAADKIQTQINQLSSVEKPDQPKIDALKQKWNEAVAKAVDALGKAVGAKPDYSPAHLLLAQAYILQGDIGNAIQKSADYYALNPSDAGAVFQLGFLFYKDNQLDNAKLAMERAVELNDNYSNARYFLGLIYDAQGNKQGAKEQFEKIAVLNPDNAEVKKILDNLNAGRGALETVVPPAAPPEQRLQTPVPETGGASGQTIKP